MRTRKREEPTHLYWIHRFVTVSAVATVLVFALSVTGWAEALYILTGVENTAVVLREDVELSDLVSQRVVRAEVGRTWDVLLDADQTVTIYQNGTVSAVESRQERLSTLLDRMNVEIGERDMVQVDLSNPGSVTVIIAPDIIYYDRETVPVAYATIRRPTVMIPEGTERVVQEGRDGETVCIFEVVWSGGELISHELVESTVTSAVDQIVEYGVTAKDDGAATVEIQINSGAEQDVEIHQVVEAVRDESANPAEEAAAEPEPEPVFQENPNKNLPMDKLVDVRSNGDGTGVLVFASGRTARYKGVKSMSATAYNKLEPKAGTVSALGNPLHKGIVAVDRRVIPLRTEVYVVAKGYEYGYGYAEDTGVIGNTIDLYFESYQGMVNFGRRSATVYILE